MSLISKLCYRTNGLGRCYAICARTVPKCQRLVVAVPDELAIRLDDISLAGPPVKYFLDESSRLSSLAGCTRHSRCPVFDSPSKFNPRLGASLGRSPNTATRSAQRTESIGGKTNSHFLTKRSEQLATPARRRRHEPSRCVRSCRRPDDRAKKQDLQRTRRHQETQAVSSRVLWVGVDDLHQTQSRSE